MTHDEMIAVIKAHKEGKTIEFRGKNNPQFMWMSCSNNNPEWSFNDTDYRIKPESNYRPFKNVEEVMKAIKEHGDWITDINKLLRIVGIYNDGITLVDCFYSYEEMLDRTFADGTPFGVKEE